MNVREEEDQAWKDRISKISKSVEKPDVVDTNEYLYEYIDYNNHFNPPDSDGLDYGEWDYSDHPEERAWYWKRWW